MEQNAFARLEGRDFEVLMTKRRIVIGRNSKLGFVDVNMGATRFISRKHLEITMEGSKFYLLCRGKNGVFVNNTFQKREAKRLQLPYSCIIRFPSTQIKLVFNSLLEDSGDLSDVRPSSPLPPSSAFQSPYITPVPSPTGTISAYNSCPASPGGTVGSHSTRLPSFDLMARYASKLLSQQNEGRVTPDSLKGEQLSIQEEEEEEEVEEQLVVSTQPSAESSGGSSPTGEQERINGVNAGGDNNNEDDDGISYPNPDERIGKDGKKYTKPPFSYAQLIVQALLASSDKRQTLNSIYQFIANKYPYYRLEDKGWKNSIRHNLSLNQYFMKAAREREGLGFGKGGYWCMHPDYEDKLTSQAYVKRKKKGIPVFPSAGLISKSAPASPTHHPFLSDMKDSDGGFLIRQPSSAAASSHPFALPSFLPQLVNATSHSLPPSPSRIPTNAGFPPQGLRFFTPLGMQSASTEALALESRRQRIEDNNNIEIPNKKPRLSNDAESLVLKPPMQQQKNLMVRPHQQPLMTQQQTLMTQQPPGMPCFPLAQTAPLRYPFVGMPMFAPQIVPQFLPIQEKKEEEQESNE